MGVLNSKPKKSGEHGVESSARCRYSLLSDGKESAQKPETPKKSSLPTKKPEDPLRESFNP